jgi:lipopolysaccharide biosynthesis glycosyltransferase
MRIPVCLASDRNYLQHLSVTMASILKNQAAGDQTRFYILENAFTDADRQKLEQLKSIASCEIVYIPVREKILDFLPVHSERLTVVTYYRLFIPELIQEEDKVIYMDCDVVVRHSLAEMYAMDMGEDYLLGVRDIRSRKWKKRLGLARYINAGILLMNCKKMREDRAYEKFMDYMTHHHDEIVLHDQDVMASVLKDGVRYIPDVWNAQVKRLHPYAQFSRAHNAHILHYTGHAKPWLPYKKANLAEEYFKYLRLTPFADYEKQYRSRRLLWRIMRIPSMLFRMIYSRKESWQETYREYRILGIRIRKKRRVPKEKQQDVKREEI